MDITSGKVSYRTPSPFEAPAATVELVFTVHDDVDAETTALNALLAARRIAMSGLTGKAPKATPVEKAEPTTTAKKPRKKAEKKADANSDLEPKKIECKTDGSDIEDDAPKADTAGGVVKAENVEDIDFDAPPPADDGPREDGMVDVTDDELQAGARNAAKRLGGPFVRAYIKESYGVDQLSKLAMDKRAELLSDLVTLEA